MTFRVQFKSRRFSSGHNNPHNAACSHFKQRCHVILLSDKGKCLIFFPLFRSLPRLSVNIPSGLAAPSWPPSPPSSRCGSASRSTMRLVPASSTASASKRNASKASSSGYKAIRCCSPRTLTQHHLLKRCLFSTSRDMWRLICT